MKFFTLIVFAATTVLYSQNADSRVATSETSPKSITAQPEPSRYGTGFSGVLDLADASEALNAHDFESACAAAIEARAAAANHEISNAAVDMVRRINSYEKSRKCALPKK